MSARRRRPREAVDDATARRHRRETAGALVAVRGLRGGGVLVADQITKVDRPRSSSARARAVEVFPGFSISRVANEGIAFGLFPGKPGAVVAVLTVVALVGDRDRPGRPGRAQRTSAAAAAACWWAAASAT